MEKKAEIQQFWWGQCREGGKICRFEGKDKWPASQFGEQRMLLPFLWAEVGTVNLPAEETALGSTWAQPDAIQASAWFELFIGPPIFCFLPTPFSFPSAYHGFLKITRLGETLSLSFEFMLFISICKRKSMLKWTICFLWFLESLLSVQCNNVTDRGRTCW